LRIRGWENRVCICILPKDWRTNSWHT